MAIVLEALIARVLKTCTCFVLFLAVAKHLFQQYSDTSLAWSYGELSTHNFLKRLLLEKRNKRFYYNGIIITKNNIMR